MTDPYQTLEVSQSASQDEIKKSYRRLAKKYHPDFNPGNREAERKFKDISHAFDLIGTKEARMKWDRGETDQQKQEQYDEYMKGETNRSKRKKPYYYNTQDTGGRYTYSFGEDLNTEDLFEGLFGGRRQRAPQDETYQLEVDFKDAALGGQKVITLPNGKSLQVTIPAGIEEGKKLRFAKQAQSGGDLFLEVKVKPLSGYKRSGKDIEMEAPVDFMDAILGGEVQVQTLEGNIRLKVPSGSTTGTKLRLKGKGVGSGVNRGNLIVSIKVTVPKEVPSDVREALRELKDRHGQKV